MKLTLWTSLVFWGAQAMACPNLSGTYACLYNDEKIAGTIVQTTEVLKLSDDKGGSQSFNLKKPSTEMTELGMITLVPACTKDTILFTGTVMGLIAKNTFTQTAKGFEMKTEAGDQTVLNAKCERR